MKIELTQMTDRTQRVEEVLSQIDNFLQAFKTNRGRPPATIHVRAADYKAVTGAAIKPVMKKLAEQARANYEKAKAEGQKNVRLKDFAAEVPEVEECTFQGIPVAPVSYSRHRAIKA